MTSCEAVAPFLIAGFVREHSQKYIYSNYLKWPDEERGELIDGIPYNMSPAPSTEHQRISRDIEMQLANYLRGKTVKIFMRPLM